MGSAAVWGRLSSRYDITITLGLLALKGYILYGLATPTRAPYIEIQFHMLLGVDPVVQALQIAQKDVI